MIISPACQAMCPHLVMPTLSRSLSIRAVLSGGLIVHTVLQGYRPRMSARLGIVLAQCSATSNLLLQPVSRPSAVPKLRTDLLARVISELPLGVGRDGIEGVVPDRRAPMACNLELNDGGDRAVHRDSRMDHRSGRGRWRESQGGAAPRRSQWSLPFSPKLLSLNTPVSRP
jgi:hypothetical protein